MTLPGEKEWNGFIQRGDEPIVRRVILESWKRSVDFEIDPLSALKSEDDFFFAQDLDSDFFSMLKTFVNYCLRGTQTSKFVWVFCDKAGGVIEVDSLNKDYLAVFQKIGVQRGVSLAEDKSGTNAVSLSIRDNKPAMCTGAEHFLKTLHYVSGAAAPLFDIDGSLKGYLALFGSYPELHGNILMGRILLLIQVLDRDLRLKRMGDSAESQKKLIGLFCQGGADAMLTVSRKAFLRQINSAAVKMLELKEHDLEEVNADRLASFKPSLKEISKTAIRVSGGDMVITLPDKKFSVKYDKYPLFGQSDDFEGVLIVFHSKKTSSSRNNNSASEAKYTFDDIIGETHAISMARQLAMRVAETSVNVLLSGLSGTGKEMFAQSIHNASDRKDKPFISINCAAIPRDIAESELFGYSEGAFTGAVKGGNKGKLESADRGTVFLDEIGDMPLELQSKLLRVLEERTITRIGESSERPVDIRVIAATNRDLSEMVNKKLFREDLYYRISVTSIHLPPLSDSTDDIPEFVNSFIEMFNETMGKRVKGLKDEIMEKFMQYNWPGNIRELRNAIEFAVMLNQGENYITWKELPGQLRMELLYSAPQQSETQMHDPLFQERKSVENSEKILYEKAIRMAGGNMTRAAEILDVGRATLYRKIKKFGISK